MDTTEGGSPAIPNDEPDTYDTQAVLEGSWRTIDGEVSFTADDFTFRLNSAALSFASTDVNGTVAQALVTSNQEWHSVLASGDVNIDLGIRSLDLDFAAETGTMIHQGRDRWRCNVDGEVKTLMNITVSSDTLIRVNYQGTAKRLYGNMGAEYNFTLNFRKEQQR